MTAAAEPWRFSAAELLEAYAARSLSPVEVTAALLDRMERLDPPLRAFLAIDREGALAAARRAEEIWMSPGEKPPLCGVPVSVKDTIEMAGLPTTYGSLAFRDNRQPDAELVRRLRQAGAVIVGKTNSPEFALGGYVANRLGASGRNPWDLSRTCGGSSGGAAAAVAAGLAPIALGTDSGGSIRQPAAYNGIFGLKPSMQRIPSVQAWRAAPGRSHNGPLTRTVRDTALVMQAIAGPDPRDPDSLLPPADYLAFAQGGVRNARIAVSENFGKSDAAPDAEVRAALQQTAALLESLGCDMVAADPPLRPGDDQLAPGVWAYSGDHYAAAEAMIPDFWTKHGTDLTDYARPIYEAGRRALAWQYRGVLRRNRAFLEGMKRWFRTVDFLLCPCTGPAPTVEEAELRKAAPFSFLVPFNHSYNPAVSVPVGFNRDGLPLAVQLVAPLGEEVALLRLAAAIEAAQPWAHRWPDYAERGLAAPRQPAIG